MMTEHMNLQDGKIYKTKIFKKLIKNILKFPAKEG